MEKNVKGESQISVVNSTSQQIGHCMRKKSINLKDKSNKTIQIETHKAKTYDIHKNNKTTSYSPTET